MIDPYSLINSKSIADYCRSINHKFNTLEIGILIYRCKHITLEKKMAYYNEILNNPTLYPNVEVKRHLHIERDTTAWDLMKGLTKGIEIELRFFNKPDKNAVFTLELNDKLGWHDSGVIFKTLHDVDNYIAKLVITGGDYYITYRIIKKYFNQAEKTIQTYRKNDANRFELFEIDDTIYSCDGPYGIKYNGIGTIWLDVPTPFKKGDIITQGKEKAVIEWLCNKDKEYVQRMKSGKGDNSGMYYLCYVIDYYGGNERKVYLENMFNYDEFEYCTEELQEFDRILKAINSFISNKISLDLFLDAYNYCKAEDMAEKEKRNFVWYTEEGLELAGLKYRNRKNLNKKRLTKL